MEAVGLLASGFSITAVAEKLSVNRTTVHRWKHELAFALELRGVMQERREVLEGRLLSLGGQAMDALEELLDGAWTARDRYSVSSFILHHALKPPDKL